jgi:2-keto-4-pentenoate hydratase/2-oxohepta-3-ene-1,7-dioic acid hydratase in catechol pathway
VASRILRIEHQGGSRYVLERDGTTRLVEGDLFEQWSAGGELRLGAEVKPGRILAPVQPSKIVGIGLNYKAHAAEVGKPLPSEPMIFLKPPTAIVGPGDPIRLPPGVGRVDYEAEVALVIGRRAYQVPRERAWDYVLGVTALNDVSARELQRRDIQYTRAKGFDTFSPMGPCLLVDGGHGPFSVEAWLNGERRQASSTADLIFGLEELVAFVSHVMTLLPGDVISTGTPSGIGPMKAGDTITVKVGGVGDLTNPVVED